MRRGMRLRTISLSDAVYRRLRAEKRPGETFSDVVVRLLQLRQRPLTKYAGAWRPISPREVREIKARIDLLRHGTLAR